MLRLNLAHDRTLHFYFTCHYYWISGVATWCEDGQTIHLWKCVDENLIGILFSEKNEYAMMSAGGLLKDGVAT